MYLYNADITNITKEISYDFHFFQSEGYKFNNNKQTKIFSLSCRCNMTYENYISLPMSMCERKIDMIIAKNPKLITSLDRYNNHPLIRKYGHIPFN